MTADHHARPATAGAEADTCDGCGECTPDGSALERWLPVPGFEGVYEVSDQGNVKSLPRPGVVGGPLKTGVRGIYRAVALSRSNRKTSMRVHSLVLLTFVGPRPPGMVTRHLNGDHLDNRLSNLTYGTPSENGFDSVQHGTNPQVRRTHCQNGHEYSPENTNVRADGRRECRTCRRAGRLRDQAIRQIKRKAARKAAQESSNFCDRCSDPIDNREGGLCGRCADDMWDRWLDRHDDIGVDG